MNNKTRRIVLPAFLIFAGANLLIFLISYVGSLVASDLFGGILEYLGFYLLSALEFLTVPVLATIMLVYYARRGMSKALSSVLILASARDLYVLPYYYLEYVYTYGSLDALLLSLFGCLRTALLTATGAVISLCIALTVLRLTLKKKHTELVPMLPELLGKKSDLDFLKPESLPLLIFVLLKFAISLILEIIYTVSFFISYGADYSAIEILTMLFDYVLLFALLVGGYLLIAFVKNKLADMPTAEDTGSIDDCQ